MENPTEDAHSEGEKGEDYLIQAVRLGMEEGSVEDDRILSLINRSLTLGLSTSDEAMAHSIRGAIYRRQKRLQEAEDEITKALKLDEKSTNFLDPFNYFLAWHDLSLIYEERGEIASAFKYREEGISKLQTLFDPPKASGAIATAHYYLAMLYLRQRDVIPSAEEEAFLNLREAVRIWPEHLANLDLGLLYTAKGKFHNGQKAKDHLERFLSLGSGTEDDRRLALEKLELVKEEI